MIFVLLVLGILFSGTLLGFPKEKKWDIAIATAIVFVETILASLLFFGMNVLRFLPVFNSLFIENIHSLFLIILFYAVVNGFILYRINRALFVRLSISLQVQTLCEYIIQWSLIYFTIYQIMFEEIIQTLKGNETAKALLTVDITNPSDMLFFVLPSLISVWIGIIAYKHYKNNL